MNRRKFIQSILVTSAYIFSTNANAFFFLRFLRGSSAGRHMSRFSRIGAKTRNVNNIRSQYSNNSRSRKRAPSRFIGSPNFRLMKEIGEITYDTNGTELSIALNNKVSAICGGDNDGVYACLFVSGFKRDLTRTVKLELAELDILDALGDLLPVKYPNVFISGGKVDEARLLSLIHPVGVIRDGEFDNEWNHILPLEYKTIEGSVRMKVMEKIATCFVIDNVVNAQYEIVIEFDAVNIATGARFRTPKTDIS